MTTVYKCVSCDWQQFTPEEKCAYCGKTETIKALPSTQVPQMKMGRPNRGHLLKVLQKESKTMTHNERIDALSEEIDKLVLSACKKHLSVQPRVMSASPRRQKVLPACGWRGLCRVRPASWVSMRAGPWEAGSWAATIFGYCRESWPSP